MRTRALATIFTALIAPAVLAQAPNDAASKAFATLRDALVSGNASRIAGFVPDGQTARFKLKGVIDADLEASKATKPLEDWFKAGASGGTWEVVASSDTGNPFRTYERKSDGRKVTITLKAVKSSYCLVSIVERG